MLHSSFIRYIRALLVLIGLFWLPTEALAYDLKLSDIRELMKQQKYSESARLLEAYVQLKPDETEALDILGVAYYQMGLPRKALKVLKLSEKISPDPPYNLLFQGLSFAVIKEYALAAYYFKQAANHPKKNSAYARLATYELASWYYNRRKIVRAKRWTRIYLSRYPNGKHVSTLREVQKHLKIGKFVGHLPGMRRPNVEQAYFTHSGLSLGSFPHYWIMETGSIYGEEDGVQITSQQDYSFQDRKTIVYAFRFLTGLGVGPFQLSGFAFNGGYTYHQIWHTTPDRVAVYSNNPSDLAYFPLRPDLQTRNHDFYLKSSFALPHYFSTGLSAVTSIERMGSRLPGPDPWTYTNSSHLMSYHFALTPWIGVQFNPRHILKSYLYLMRWINKEDPQFSHQSITNQSLPASLGALYHGNFPKIKLQVELDGRYYQYLFNDPYLDHKDLGISGRITHDLTSNLHLYLSGSWSRKKYTEPHLKIGQCSLFRKKKPNPGENNQQKPPDLKTHDPVRCDRVDKIWNANGGVSFTFKEHYGFFARAEFNSNTNVNIQELSFRNLYYRCGFSMAFPNVSKVTDYTYIHSRKPLNISTRQ